MLRVYSVLADAAGISSSQSDEALLAPGSSPGVLALPVLIRHSNQQDHVIEAGAAIAEDATRVNRPLAGIHRHRHGLFHDGRSKISAAVD